MERSTRERGKMKSLFSTDGLKFIQRFTIVHVLTYTMFGILFMSVSSYFDYFSRDPIFSVVMKPADALTVRLAIPFQIFRGILLAVAIFPFRESVLQKPYGWLKLFWLMFVLTSVGAVITGPGSIEGFLYTNFEFNPFIGYPEISLQMIVFSWFLFKWYEIAPKRT